MIRGPAAASGFSSRGGGAGTSSIFGFSGFGASIAAVGAGAGGWLRLANVRQAKMPPAATTSRTAMTAYFVLPLESGTPAGGRLEEGGVGGLIRYSLRVAPRVSTARSGEYSGFVECKGCIAVRAGPNSSEPLYIWGRRAGGVFQHDVGEGTENARAGKLGQRIGDGARVDHGVWRIDQDQIEGGVLHQLGGHRRDPRSDDAGMIGQAKSRHVFANGCKRRAR